MIFLKVFLPLLEVFVVFFCIIKSSYAGTFDSSYYPRNLYDRQQQEQELEANINAALGKLEQAPQWVSDWPDSSVKLGQVSGVALDNAGRLLVFHRAGNVWDGRTFSDKNVYLDLPKPAIPDPTILIFNETGELVDMWGQNLFYMPHGITVDHAGNVWVTDVAQHQVFKFTPDDRQKPALTLGHQFVPKSIDGYFCKPSAVAVLANGDFFVADGYCNHRIIKYSPSGSIILQWGKAVGDDPFVFQVPHALALAEERGLVCVADRERGRVACFRADNGTYVTGFSSWLVGTRLFSVTYAPVHGGRLYIVNGPYSNVPVRGYVIDFDSGRLIQTFAPPGDFHNPHDLVVTNDGSTLYVAELDPHRVYKFFDETLKNESRSLKSNITIHKPTTTIELSSSSGGGGGGGVGSAWEWWAGAGWASAGALAAGLLALAALGLLRARSRGRKGLPRRRWEYGRGEFKLRRLLERRRFTRVHSDDSDEEPAPMLPPQQPPAHA